MTKMLLAVHIAGGATALLSMIVPLVSRKGGITHRRAGWVFAGGMTVVSITALLLSAHRFLFESWPGAATSAVFLGYLGILTGGGVSAGIRVLRAKARRAAHRHPWDIGMSALVTGGALALGAYGLSIDEPLLTGFSIVGILSGGTQLRYWLRPAGHPMHWWFEHMNQMLGSCIAAVTAFLVNNVSRLGIPMENGSLIVWLGPTVIGVPGMIIWIGYYRRRFTSIAPPRRAAAAAAGRAAPADLIS
jgi:hypothetical protein